MEETAEQKEIWDKLEYRAEGNSSIVFTTGGFVFRFVKSEKHLLRSLEEIKVLSSRQWHRHSFIQDVMNPLFGPSLIFAGELIKLTEDEIKVVQRIATEAPRPDHRLDKVIDENCQYVAKMPDLCFIHPRTNIESPTFAIELKPKCGFLPEPKNDDVSLTMCSFCSKQFLKAQVQCNYTRSKYCPLNLYSGDSDQMNFAIKCLLETPQNNLRIFKDGDVIYHESSKNLEKVREALWPYLSVTEASVDSSEDPLVRFVIEFSHLLTQCLLLPMHEEGGTNGSKSIIHPCLPTNLALAKTCTSSEYQQCNKIKRRKRNRSGTNGHGTTLPKGCILDSVLCVQLLGYPGISQLYPAYQKLTSHLTQSQTARKATLLDGPYRSFAEPCRSFKEQELNNAVDKIKQYLVARTAIDCSVIISLQPVTTNTLKKFQRSHHIIKSRSGHSFLVNIGIVDLDPKSIDNIAKYMDMEKQFLDVEKRLFKLDGRPA